MTIEEVIAEVIGLELAIDDEQVIIDMLKQIRDRHDRETALLYELATDAANVIKKHLHWGGLGAESKVIRRLQETVNRVKQLEDD